MGAHKNVALQPKKKRDKLPEGDTRRQANSAALTVPSVPYLDVEPLNLHSEKNGVSIFLHKRRNYFLLYFPSKSEKLSFLKAGEESSYLASIPLWVPRIERLELYQATGGNPKPSSSYRKKSSQLLRTHLNKPLPSR